jgi:hypothetical protein
VETLVPLDDVANGEVGPPALPISPREQLLAAAMAFAVLVQAALFAAVCAAGLVRQPFSDMFDFLRDEFALERTGDLAGYLGATHNGQHLVWIRVLTALDVQVFHGSALIFAIAGAAAILGAATMTAWTIQRSVGVRLAGAIAAGLAAMLLISTVNALDAVQPINVVYALAFGSAVAAVVLFEAAGEAAPARAAVLGGLALLAAVSAVAASGAGVAVLAALAISAFRDGAQRRLLAPTLVLALIAAAVVASGLASETYAARPDAGAGRLLRSAGYFVTYAGLPWSTIGALSRARLIIGAATLALGAALIGRGARRAGPAGRLERIGVDLMLFALITAAMAALGRVDETPAGVVPVRYGVFMSAFQAGAVCTLAPALAERWTTARRWVVPAALALAAALLVQQVAYGANVLETSRIIRREIAAFQAGVRRPGMRQTVHPDFALAAQIEDECRRRGIYQ